MTPDDAINILLPRWTKRDTRTDTDYRDGDNYCITCGKKGWVRLDYFGASEHQSCAHAERLRWVNGLLALARDAGTQELAKEVPVQPGSIDSLSGAVATLRQELEAFRSALQARDDTIAQLIIERERINKDRQVLSERCRLLSGERLPDSDADFTALAEQAIHYSGGPN